jgi:pyridoxine 4-dehydrogenase
LPDPCVQNTYNLADRSDQALLDACAADGVAYVPFFPLGSAFHPDKPVANRLGATTAQVALAWLLQRSPNLLLIPGTSSLTHLRENLAAAELELDARRHRVTVVLVVEGVAGGVHDA